MARTGARSARAPLRAPARAPALRAPALRAPRGPRVPRECCRARVPRWRRATSRTRALAVEDDVIDTLNREVFARALAISRPVGRREVAMHQMLLARSLERVADNAVDIGEQVVLLVTGELQEFSDASKPRPRVLTAGRCAGTPAGDRSPAGAGLTVIWVLHILARVGEKTAGSHT